MRIRRRMVMTRSLRFGTGHRAVFAVAEEDGWDNIISPIDRTNDVY
jgi:hypothetical protein